MHNFTATIHSDLLILARFVVVVELGKNYCSGVLNLEWLKSTQLDLKSSGILLRRHIKYSPTSSHQNINLFSFN
jgi:hypothetical protein